MGIFSMVFIEMLCIKIAMSLDSNISSYKLISNSNVIIGFKRNYLIQQISTDSDFKKARFNYLRMCSRITNCNSIVISLSSNKTWEILLFSVNPEYKNAISNNSSSTIYIRTLGGVQLLDSPQTIIQSDNITIWGVWHPTVYCPPYSYAIGLNVKVEVTEGAGLNSIKLICNDAALTAIQSGDGYYGIWDTEIFCSNGKRLNGFKFKAQTNQGSGDDTAANGIHMFCEDGTSLVPLLEGNKGTWGQVKYCRNGQFICGIQCQIEPDQGTGDDTGLNNVKFFCCSQ